jgi:hypothetical protein
MSIPIQSRSAFGKRFGLAPDAIFRLWQSALKDDESLIDEAIAATYDRMISIDPVRAVILFKMATAQALCAPSRRR